MDLSQHSKFFDHLVELVPAKYYLDAGADEKVGCGDCREAGLRLAAPPPSAAGGCQKSAASSVVCGPMQAAQPEMCLEMKY